MEGGGCRLFAVRKTKGREKSEFLSKKGEGRKHRMRVS